MRPSTTRAASTPSFDQPRQDRQQRDALALDLDVHRQREPTVTCVDHLGKPIVFRHDQPGPKICAQLICQPSASSLRRSASDKACQRSAAFRPWKAKTRAPRSPPAAAARIMAKPLRCSRSRWARSRARSRRKRWPPLNCVRIAVRPPDRSAHRHRRKRYAPHPLLLYRPRRRAGRL